MNEIREISNIQEHNNLVESGDLFVLDFYKNNCVPCDQILPVLEKFSEKKGIPVYKVHVNKIPELITKYRIKSTPTMIIIKDRKVSGMIIGLIGYEKLVSLLQVGS